MIIVPFKAEHVHAIHLQPAQLEMAGKMDGGYGEELESTGLALTAIDGDEVIACGGKAKIGNIWVMWALLSNSARFRLTAFTKVALRIINMHDGWLYVGVRPDFEQGHRWARILGFKYRAGPLPIEDGSLVTLYGRLC